MVKWKKKLLHVTNWEEEQRETVTFQVHLLGSEL